MSQTRRQRCARAEEQRIAIQRLHVNLSFHIQLLTLPRAGDERVHRTQPTRAGHHVQTRMQKNKNACTPFQFSISMNARAKRCRLRHCAGCCILCDWQRGIQMERCLAHVAMMMSQGRVSAKLAAGAASWCALF